jgi:hypothetical protein
MKILLGHDTGEGNQGINDRLLDFALSWFMIRLLSFASMAMLLAHNLGHGNFLLSQ